jgi:hypothetical protein
MCSFQDIAENNNMNGYTSPSDFFLSLMYTEIRVRMHL